MVSTAPADPSPPIGSQPVRAARNTRNSEVRSGGVDSSTSDVPPTIAAVAGAQLRQLLTSGARAQRLGGEIAGRQPREQQRRRRHGEHEQEREQKSPKEITEHRLVTD